MKSEDVIEFELTSIDIWLKVYMVLSWGNKVHNVSFEVRAERDMSISQFHAYLCKSIITIWNQIQIQDMQDITFYFLDSVKAVKVIKVRANLWL